MTTLEDAIARYPPTIPSCSSSRKTCETPCPPCPNIRPPISGSSSVHFQVAYNCNGCATFSPCYYPRPVPCPPPEIPQKRTYAYALPYLRSSADIYEEAAETISAPAVATLYTDVFNNAVLYDNLCREHLGASGNMKKTLPPVV